MAVRIILEVTPEEADIIDKAVKEGRFATFNLMRYAKYDDAEPGFTIAYLRRCLAALLSVEETTIDLDAELSSLGVGSTIAADFCLRVNQDLRTDAPLDQFSLNTTLRELSEWLVKHLSVQTERLLHIEPLVESFKEASAPSTPQPLSEATELVEPATSRPHSSNAALICDSAAIICLSERIDPIIEDQVTSIYGTDPFLSHVYETSLGRIGIITLPFSDRSRFYSPQIKGMMKKAAELAFGHEARYISLTGLIPLVTDNVRSVVEWLGTEIESPVLTTGNATIAAAAMLNYQNALYLCSRDPSSEHLSILGLGPVGHSCLSLAMDVLPHPRSVLLCDVFARKPELINAAKVLHDRHGFRGPVHVLTSDGGIPDEFFRATSILSAVNVPEVLDVNRVRPGTIIVEASSLPSFSMQKVIERTEATADLLFVNGRRVRLAEQIIKKSFLDLTGQALFGEELDSDLNELPASILSSVPPLQSETSIDIVHRSGLISQYETLAQLGIMASLPRYGPYVIPQIAIDNMRQGFRTLRGFLSWDVSVFE